MQDYAKSQERLRRFYLQKLSGASQTLGAFLGSLQDDSPGMYARDEINRLVHSLVGSGTLFGFPEITDVARVLDGRLRADGGDFAACRELIEKLRDLCAVGSQDEKTIHFIEAAPPLQKATLLIVDDDREITEFLSMYFLVRHMRVNVATNGKDALDSIAASRPDIILMDIDMPQLNGQEALRAIKEDPQLQNIPVIMLTSHIEQSHIASAFDSGAADYVVKPFDMMHLIVKVEDLLRVINKTVLIVENETEASELLAGLYRDKGYRVLSANTGLAAWRMITKESPNLVVLDWRLPRMDALDLLKNLRADARTSVVPVIIIASQDEDADDYKGSGFYVIDKLAVPYDLVKRSAALMTQKR